MTDSVVTIEKERSVRHWFKSNFYRKEGEKDVLDLRKCKWFFGATAIAALAVAFFQGSPIIDAGIDREATNATGFLEFPSEQSIVIDEKKQGSSVGKRPKLALGPQLVSRPRAPIPPSAIVRAKLLGAGADGPVRAVVMENVLLRGELAIASGTMLIGAGSSTEDRLIIRFTQMIDKEGRVQPVQAQALDKEDQTLGLKGPNLKDTALKLGGSMGLNFLGGMTEGLQETEAKQGVAFRKSTLKNALLQGASRTALEEARELMSEMKNTKPAIRVDTDTEFLVGFEGER